MSRNKDAELVEAKPAKANQETANASPEQLSEHQLDKVVGGSVGGAALAGAAAGAGGGVGTQSNLLKRVSDTAHSIIENYK
jgi:hypothetical protein